MKVYMKMMIKVIIATNIYVLTLINLSLFAQTGIHVPEMEDVDTTILDFMETWDVPGASVAISKEGRLVYARGFGFANLITQEEVMPYHKFIIASVSKPITSVAILKLLEQNQISLDDKVFGPEGILSDSIYSSIRDSLVKNITIKDLLWHTGGWDRNISGDPMFKSLEIATKMNVPPPPTQEIIIEYMLKYNLDFNPGTDYAYSNFGYCILGRVIEKITGMTYADYVLDQILHPIGANDTQLGKNLLADAAIHEVYYYMFDGAPLANSVYGTGALVEWPYGGFDVEAMDAHGGWISTATDLVRFMLAVDGFNTRPDILSPATINLMRTPSPVNQNYALGWAVNSQGNWWHNGSLPGTSSILVRTTMDRMCWAVLINYRPSNSGAFSSALDGMMWDAVNTVSTWPEHDLFDSLTVIQNDKTIAQHFQLYQNYPNPFNPGTTIGYNLAVDSDVKLILYDISGQKITILVSERQHAGYHQIYWDASQLASGIYYYNLRARNYSDMKKMILLK
jgi:CubicO group peptidase (beta-lactamase class C family)